MISSSTHGQFGLPWHLAAWVTFEKRGFHKAVYFSLAPTGNMISEATFQLFPTFIQ